MEYVLQRHPHVDIYSAEDVNSWSPGALPGSSDVRSLAYQRALAAFLRLEALAVWGWHKKSQLHEKRSSEMWTKLVIELVELQREWNDAFCEFDLAVSTYRNADKREDHSPPRKPR